MVPSSRLARALAALSIASTLAFVSALGTQRLTTPPTREPGEQSLRDDPPEVPEETQQALARIGYLPYARIERGDEERRGVELHDAARAWPGVNIVFPEFGCRTIHFLDNDGVLLREIDVRMLPRRECFVLEPVEDGYVFLAEPSLYRIDEAGLVVWSIQGSHVFHHDLGVRDGLIVTLDEIERDAELDGETGRVIDNRIVLIDASGKVLRTISLHDIFWKDVLELARSHDLSPFSPEATQTLGMGGSGDFYHANSVQILEHDSAIGSAGDVLISIRTLDTIAVLDLETQSVVWRWGPGVLDHQHHPTLLPDGRLLVFDNGYMRGFSRVLEIAPESGEIVWEYRGEPEQSFFTKRRGGADRLGNGNTLITESDRGRVFEVDPKGGIVWDYWMPPSPTGRKRHTIFRVQRMDGSAYEARQQQLDASTG